MSKKRQSIAEQIETLQKRNDSLEKLEKLMNSYTKSEFGYTIEKLHEIVRKQETYERKMREREASKQTQKQ